MRTASIIGTGLYAPERVVPNEYFNELYGEDVDSFLRERRNIKERRYAAEDQATSDLAAEASRMALEKAGVDATDIDLIVVSTDTPDYLSPSTAAVLQDKLGAVNAATFDLNTACAGFVTALDTARKFVEADASYEHVLVVGAYLMSRFIDYEQKNVASLFADGSGAAVLKGRGAAEADDGGRILTSKLKSEGQFAEYMGIYTGGAAAPISPNVEGDGAPSRVQKLEFRKKFPDGFNPDHWTRLVHELCDDLDVTPQGVDRYFFTQINIESIRETLKRLDLPEEKAHNVMDRFGYTGNACIAMALADADAQGMLSAGDLVFLIASGGGAAIAGMALRWGP
ncbi:3-ketoacyl-ACP synthase [Longibacter salinarum]|uniref:3-ketoacyl-ACP synthase n=1 Tax=Longibacter salinarum TaxID=1850348 RepID=A0A2A8CUY1_9BACT|nr:ketoacyl-ACP synthase III [Longibacter salinarum]PEN12258.1 3-ketoacyl-ACP synthase [Longibacter salinarum]